MQIEKSAQTALSGAGQGSYDPERYDLYAVLDADVFARALSQADGMSIKIEASGRPIAITINSVRMVFRPGSPIVSLDAQARDLRTGIVAKLALDSRLMLDGDPAKPKELKVRIVATKLVPELRWGGIGTAKSRFVSALLQLQASRLTDRLPVFSLPLARNFAFGRPEGMVDSGRIDTGNGSWIRGNVSYPSTFTQQRFVVRNMLFLANGLHVFADVEAI